MQRRMLLISAALLPIGAAGAAEDEKADAAASVFARLQQVKRMSADFAQTKKLKGRRKPLESSGRFFLDQEEGVAFLQKQPFSHRTLVLKDRIVTVYPGEAPSELRAGGNSAAAELFSMLPALFSGESSVILKSFAVKAEELPRGTWRLTLTPRTPALAKVFEFVQLTGDDAAEKALIREKTGDRTEVVLSSRVLNPKKENFKNVFRP